MTQAEATTVQKKGVISKCPSCGAPVGAFASVCQSCGHEFAEIDANRTIRALVNRFEEIEREVERQGLGLSRRTQQILEKKSRVIRDFPIPNAREDLQQLIHFIHPKIVDSVKPDPNVEDWRAKFAEVMSRAKAAYKGDAAALAEFGRLEKGLDTGLADGLKIKARRNPLVVLLLVAGVLAGIGGLVNARMEQAKLARCEADYAARSGSENGRLEKIYASAAQELRARRYTEAMAAATRIRWEQEPSGCRANENVKARGNWDAKRTELVALIRQGVDAATAERQAETDRLAAQQKAEAEQQAAVQQAEEKRAEEAARAVAERQRAAAERARSAAARAATERRKAATEQVF